jgi:hypothetical protein
VRRSRRGQGRDGADISDDDSAIEVLPDRFDAQGHPLDSSGRIIPQWTSRHGQFERRPRHPGDWDIRGLWGVGGTDHEAVERIVQDVEGVLSGQGGWMGLLRDVVGGVRALSHEGREMIEDDSDSAARRRWRRRRSH